MNKSVFISITLVILLSVGSSHAQELRSDENDQEAIRNFDDDTWQVDYQENFDSNDSAAGVYMLYLHAGSYIATKRMILVK